MAQALALQTNIRKTVVVSFLSVKLLSVMELEPPGRTSYIASYVLTKICQYNRGIYFTFDFGWYILSILILSVKI